MTRYTPFDEKVVQAITELFIERRRRVYPITINEVINHLSLNNTSRRAILSSARKGVKAGDLYEIKRKDAGHIIGFLRSCARYYQSFEKEMLHRLPLFMNHFFETQQVEILGNIIFLASTPCCDENVEFRFNFVNDSLYGYCPVCKKEGNPLYFAEHVWEHEMLSRFNLWREKHFMERLFDKDIKVRSYDGPIQDLLYPFSPLYPYK